MKSFAPLTLALLALTGCTSSNQVLDYPDLPPGLQDCKFYKLVNFDSVIKVARCPNSTTTVRMSDRAQTAAVLTVPPAQPAPTLHSAPLPIPQGLAEAPDTFELNGHQYIRRDLAGKPPVRQPE